jgi:CheY-like chemotaxis protein
MVLDGQEGLDVLQERRPDLIVSDAVMPRMDGFEFCRQVKLDPSLRTIPFVLLTSLSQNLRERALSAGADDYLGKQSSDLIFRMRIRLMLEIGLRGGIQPEPAVPAEPRTLLVVSPNRTIQAQLFTHLSKDGVQVLEITDPAAVPAHLKTRGADGLILDLEQPEGILEELIDTIRIQPALAGLPIIALAAKDEETKLEPFEREVQDRLLKPLDGAESRHRIKLLLRLAGLAPVRG